METAKEQRVIARYKTGFMDMVETIVYDPPRVDYIAPTISEEYFKVYAEFRERYARAIRDFKEYYESGEWLDDIAMICRMLGLEFKKDVARKIMYNLYVETEGYRSLDPVFWDKYVDDVSISANGKVYVMHRLVYRGRWAPTNIVLLRDELRGIANVLTNNTLTHTNPVVETNKIVTLTGRRARIKASHENISRGAPVMGIGVYEATQSSPVMTIRLFPEVPLTIFDLIRSGMLNVGIASYLMMYILAKDFMIIAGEMGAGKTTLMMALLELVSRYQKIVTIEDVAEIYLAHELWNGYITYKPYYRGAEVVEVGVEELLESALRDSADWIVVAECRRPKRDLVRILEARNLGSGSMTTMHGGTAEEVITRLRLAIDDPSLLDWLRLVVVLKRVPYKDRMVRRVVEVAEIYDGGKRLNRVFFWNGVEHFPEKLVEPTPMLVSLAPYLNIVAETEEEKKQKIMELYNYIYDKFTEYLRNYTGEENREYRVRFVERFTDEIYRYFYGMGTR